MVVELNIKYIIDNTGTEVIKILKNKNLSESIRDVRWLISVNRLPVRAIVSWSCYETTKKCPMIFCNDDETQQHLLEDCYRAQEVWSKIGLVFTITVSCIVFWKRMFPLSRKNFTS